MTLMGFLSRAPSLSGKSMEIMMSNLGRMVKNVPLAVLRAEKSCNGSKNLLQIA
jgi:hypothetical protein